MSNIVIDELDKIGRMLLEQQVDVPADAFLGVHAYESLRRHYATRMVYTAGSTPSTVPHISMMHLAAGSVSIKCDPSLPKDHVSIGIFTSANAGLIFTLDRLDLLKPKIN